MTGPRIAFYAPMKSPDHPTPSGDREIARLTIRALETAGYRIDLASDLRIFDRDGDPTKQADLTKAADKEADRLIEHYRQARPDIWFTYHCHYKAPDLIGPKVSAGLGIPYVLSEPSISPKRREGPWADFAKASESAIASADLLLWTTTRDRPALEDAGHSRKMLHLPAFVDVGPDPTPSPADDPLRLLTVAMMRPGDKLESYRRLAAALVHMPRDWHLTVIGDGPERARVERMFAPHMARVQLLGAIDDKHEIRRSLQEADLFVWPGVGEGVGMVYLEAQAAGLPVIAEDHPAQRDLIVTPLAPPDQAFDLADLIVQIAEDREAHGIRARTHVVGRHSLKAAADRLGRAIKGLIE